MRTMNCEVNVIRFWKYGLFVVDGGDDAGRKMLNNMTVASQAISLGGVESLISMPYATTHASWTQEARITAGIDLGLFDFQQV